MSDANSSRIRSAMPVKSVQPKLAIIITCYNYEAYVGQAIRSVLAERRDDCELVVIDDGSSDASWGVILRSGVDAVRVTNCGQRKACIHGLDRTRAPFILFLDADDELKPGSLATIIAALDDDVAKLQFPLTRIDRDGHVISTALPSLEDFRARESLARRVLRTGVYTSPPTSGNVFRRDLCELLREADYDLAVDGIILFAAPFLGDVVSLSEELGRYRIHDRNDSGLGRPLDPNALERDLVRFVQRMNHLRLTIRRLGRNAKSSGALKPAEQMFFYQERSFYLNIARGQRPSLKHLASLLMRLFAEFYPFRTKMALAGFYVAAVLLPSARAKALLAYRLQAGRRSALGFLSVMRGGPLTTTDH